MNKSQGVFFLVLYFVCFVSMPRIGTGDFSISMQNGRPNGAVGVAPVAGGQGAWSLGFVSEGGIFSNSTPFTIIAHFVFDS